MHTYYRANIFERLIFLDKHAFTYEQYCSVVEKNIILQETSYYNGKKKIRCLNHLKCKHEFGGCKNKFVIAKQEKAAEAIEKTQP